MLAWTTAFTVPANTSSAALWTQQLTNKHGPYEAPKIGHAVYDCHACGSCRACSHCRAHKFFAIISAEQGARAMHCSVTCRLQAEHGHTQHLCSLT